jgi:hypothetical protein
MKKRSRQRSNPEVVQNKGLVTREEPQKSRGGPRAEPEKPEEPGTAPGCGFLRPKSVVLETLWWYTAFN